MGWSASRCNSLKALFSSRRLWKYFSRPSTEIEKYRSSGNLLIWRANRPKTKGEWSIKIACKICVMSAICLCNVVNILVEYISSKHYVVFIEESLYVGSMVCWTFILGLTSSIYNIQIWVCLLVWNTVMLVRWNIRKSICA